MAGMDVTEAVLLLPGPWPRMLVETNSNQNRGNHDHRPHKPN
jgi:hypothetical protein